MSACLRLSVFISQAMRSMFNISLYEWTVPTFNQFPKYSSNDGHIEIVKSLHSGQPAWLDVGFLVSSGESCPWARKNLISCVQNALLIDSPRCFKANQSSQIPLNVILRSWSMGWVKIALHQPLYYITPFTICSLTMHCSASSKYSAMLSTSSRIFLMPSMVEPQYPQG